MCCASEASDAVELWTLFSEMASDKRASYPCQTSMLHARPMQDHSTCPLDPRGNHSRALWTSPMGFPLLIVVTACMVSLQLIMTSRKGNKHTQKKRKHRGDLGKLATYSFSRKDLHHRVSHRRVPDVILRCQHKHCMAYAIRGQHVLILTQGFAP